MCLCGRVWHGNRICSIKKICAVACNCARMACKSCNCKVLVQVAVYLLSLCRSRSAGSVDFVCYLCHVELCLFGFCCSAHVESIRHGYVIFKCITE